MRDTKYILFIVGERKEREIAKEEDQCKKSKGVITLKISRVFTCVCHLENPRYLRGFLSIVTFVFLDLGGGYAKASYVATCYIAKLCFLCTFLYVPLSISLSEYHFPPSYKVKNVESP